MRSGAEVIAPMQQRHALGDGLQIENPVERAVAAADDQQIFVAELLHLAHGIEHRLAFIGLDARHRRTLGLERAAACRDHDNLAFEHLTGIGRHAKQRIADLLDALDHFVEMKSGVERLDLLHQGVREALPRHHRNSGNVVDRLLRIKLRALAAELVENIDEVNLHIEQAQLKYREQPARAGADNQDVRFDRFSHARSASLG